MEFETGGCRGLASAVVGLLLLLCVIGAVVIGATADSNMTTRAEAKAKAQEAQAQYRYQAAKAQADADTEQVRIHETELTQRRLDELNYRIDRMLVAQANYEQRLGTLAVALAGLDDADADRLVAAAADESPSLDWLAIGIAAVWGLAVGFAIIRFSPRLGESLNRVYNEWMDWRAQE